MDVVGLSLGVPAVVALLVGVAGCDLGAKSVGKTAGDGGSDGSDSMDSGVGDASTDGDGDGNTSQGDGGGPVGEPPCLETVTLIGDPSQVTALGFSADEVIAISNGWSTQLAWLPNDGPVTVVAAATVTDLNVGMTYVGGEIRFVESVRNPANPQEGPGCDDRLELEVEIEFNTADGRFAEVFTTMGSSTAAGELSVREYFAVDAFSGSFSDAEVTYDGGEGTVDRFGIFADFSGTESPTGSVSVEITLGGPGDGSGVGVLAQFPGLPR